MKKIIIALILVMAMMLCLPSCDKSSEYKEDLKALDALAANGAKSYTIEITVASAEGERITELYTVKETNGERTVKYKIEKLNGFVVDGDSISAPNEYMSVSEGTFDAAESASEKYAFPSFSFNSNNLSVNKISDHGTYSVMQASINSLNGFTGGSIDGQDPNVTITYNDYQITSIALSYTTASGNTATVTYTIK